MLQKKIVEKSLTQDDIKCKLLNYFHLPSRGGSFLLLTQSSGSTLWANRFLFSQFSVGCSAAEEVHKSRHWCFLAPADSKVFGWMTTHKRDEIFDKESETETTNLQFFGSASAQMKALPFFGQLPIRLQVSFWYVVETEMKWKIYFKSSRVKFILQFSKNI